MSGNSGNIEWYLARDGQQHGPLSAAELDKFIELGHLKPTDLLWRAGFDDWRTATEVFPPRPPQQAPPHPAAPEVPAAALPQGSGEFRQPEPDQPSPEAAATARHDDVTQPVRQDPVRQDPVRRGYDPGDRQDFAMAPRDSAPVARGESAVPAGERGAAPDAGAGYAPAPQAGAQPFTVQPGAPLATADPAPSRSMHAAPTAENQPYPASRATTSVRPADQFVDEEFLEEEEGGRGGWLMVAAALFLFVLLGAGGLFAYNNQTEIAALYKDIMGTTQPGEVAVVRAPKQPTREVAPKREPPVASTPVTAPSPTPAAAPAAAAVPELPILKSKLWQYAQREMGNWTTERLAELAEQDQSKEEANAYLIASFVRFRRENANHAMLASSQSLEEVATAFVTSLRALTERGPNACYAFISNGETTPEIAPLYMEPSIGPTLEAQMLAIMKAIVDGKTSPTSKRKPPTSDDFSKLSSELGKRGWSAADLKLFSDPGALSKAEPKVVCRLVTEWFSTQTALADQAARDQLIAASLRPVIGG